MSDRGKQWFRWGLGIAALPVVYLLNILFLIVVTGREGEVGTWPARIHAGILAALTLAAALWTGRTVWEILTALRSRRQRQAPEPASPDAPDDLDDLDDDVAFGAAGALAKTLLTGKALPGNITVASVVHLPGEAFHLEAPIHAEQAARSDAGANRWGEKQQVQIAVSNKRVVLIGDDGSQSLEHPRITGVHPYYREACLILETDQGTSLRLTGFAAPQVAVWIEYTKRGRPRIEELRATTFAEPPS